MKIFPCKDCLIDITCTKICDKLIKIVVQKQEYVNAFAKIVKGYHKNIIKISKVVRFSKDYFEIKCDFSLGYYGESTFSNNFLISREQLYNILKGKYKL